MEDHSHDGWPEGSWDTGSTDDSLLGTGLTTRHLEAFGRKVTSTATHLMGPTSDPHYQSALTDIHRELRRPALQRRMFSLTRTSPTDLVRSKLSTAEIQSRALSSLPDELLANLPEDNSSYSLFQGFQATLPESEHEHHRSHRRRSSKHQKVITDAEPTKALPHSKGGLKAERERLNHRLEMMGIRKNMCSAEIHEIDNKITNLHNMRQIVLDRLAGLEVDETELENQIVELDNKIEDMEDEEEEEETTAKATPTKTNDSSEDAALDASFMSESIYQKLPTTSPRGRKVRSIRKKSMPILHEHFAPGTAIKEIPAHNDIITALDFDYPFGTLVSAALDDTVRVWDLNAGRCVGFLEGHHASVRCLQVEDNFVATGSMDASIRIWDLSQAQPVPQNDRINKSSKDEDAEEGDDSAAAAPSYTASNMADCEIFSLEAHVDEVTALHFRGETLISGSADKTLRQWDLVKGRCVQTLDVLWAAAQASTSISTNSNSQWRPTGRLPDASADFVGAVQFFDAALACGTADGIIRLWDLRSGQVHRSLVGHTGPVTCLQFDDVHLVTGSLDRSIRIWDLRTGSIHDAFAYDHPITSMMFDTRRIASAAGENVVKVYDKTDGHHWDCGAGAGEGGENASIIERVRVKDGYLVEGRKDGIVGVWTC
ncbi:WD repeat-containing protein [Talaromyces stipitatus ATCC 10500]|uniref:Mitochondrial division protein 1 n=1 Tax=Talaromyces stipitatus (strain ATCC 10500 / CBS 375.48 / QM 6759 / NRRL 1006) TaxID=441959 RepID=B8MRH7_TALSN|nr:WD repeat-containing protein [Talaromyces stipitatus ATCC 10500]EED13114.1 WD repeat-containing protein [Talaromyces stipitatus ATCC 10500]